MRLPKIIFDSVKANPSLFYVGSEGDKSAGVKSPFNEIIVGVDEFQYKVGKKNMPGISFWLDNKNTSNSEALQPLLDHVVSEFKRVEPTVADKDMSTSVSFAESSFDKDTLSKLLKEHDNDGHAYKPRIKYESSKIILLVSSVKYETFKVKSGDIVHKLAIKMRILGKNPTLELYEPPVTEPSVDDLWDELDESDEEEMMNVE